VGYSLLHWAAEHGDAAFCRSLLQLDANPLARDDRGCSAIDHARSAGHGHVVGLLRLGARSPSPGSPSKRQVSVRAEGGVALPLAGGQTAVDSLSQTSRRSDDHSNERLGFVHTEILRQIEEVGWANMKWNCNFTLLHWAAQNDRPEVCSILMAKSADPCLRDDSGKDALDYASQQNARSALVELTRYGASLSG